MTCQEVVFANAVCRIEIEPRPYALNGPSFAALMYVSGDDNALRPVLLRDGARVEAHGTTEAIALNSAVTMLEGWFGAITEPAHRCIDPPIPPRFAEPYILTD
jgi:hypothetical protein